VLSQLSALAFVQCPVSMTFSGKQILQETKVFVSIRNLEYLACLYSMHKVKQALPPICHKTHTPLSLFTSSFYSPCPGLCSFRSVIWCVCLCCVFWSVINCLIYVTQHIIEPN
jgi:hypothetical protein